MDKKTDSYQETIYYETDSLYLFHHNFYSDDYANHWHNSVEIIMPIQNMYTVVMENQVYSLRENDILIIPPGELHEIKAPKGKGQRILLQFSIEVLNTIRGFIKSSYIFMDSWLITPENNAELNQAIKTLLYEMLDEFLSRNIHHNIAITNRIIEIALQLTRKKQMENDLQYKALIKRREHTERFNECLDYINRHYNEGLTLETVAQAVCFSKFHFSRWFREFANLSFHDYLNKLRIDKAETMLLCTSLTVTEIALEAGFQSTNTFNRLFRKHKDCTPTEYRNLYHLKQRHQTALAPVGEEPEITDTVAFIQKPPAPADRAAVSTAECGAKGTLPILWADVPDPDVIRVGDVYYMVSTTMHYCPGIPVMKSRDLIRWDIVNYVYDILDDSDDNALRNGANAYGRGSWAGCLRYHGGTFYVTAASLNTQKTYIFQTENIENGPWRRYEINELLHDPSMLFDDDGRVYIVYGSGAIHLAEVNADATALLPGGTSRIIIKNANAGGSGGLPAEGSHLYKIDGWYYLFLIAWPKTGSKRRIELCYRAEQITGPYEGRVIFDDDLNYKNMGVAQGGIVDTPDGKWYAMLFQDHGAVGRVPVLIPVTWQDKWPRLTMDDDVSEPLSLGGEGGGASDEFYPVYQHKRYAANNCSAYRYEHLTQDDSAEVKQEKTELLVNNCFQAGTDGWDVTEVAEISVTEEEDFNGQPVLLVTNRFTTASGPCQNITGKVSPGGIYETLAWVKYTSGPPVKSFNICIGNGTTWQGIEIMGTGRLVRGEWGTLRGTYTLPDDADLSETTIFIETPWSGKPQKTKDMMDFYVGSVSMTAEPFLFNTKARPGENDPIEPYPALAWQWNHNPDHNLWSLTERYSHLRLKSGYLSRGLPEARNTLTQRAFGPECAGVVSLDTSGMKDGDIAGLAAWQELYGYAGVKIVNGERFIVMTGAAQAQEMYSIPLLQNRIFLRLEFDFDNKDMARFYYSLDEVSWMAIGDALQMEYRLSHFTGYRFALFYYSTQTVGGHADFDYFRLCRPISRSDTALTLLNAFLDGDVTAVGVKGEEIELRVHMDTLPEDEYKGLYLSLPIPPLLDVTDVIFCDDNIAGRAEYSVEGRQLRLSVTGHGVSFTGSTSDLLATIRFTVNDYTAENTTIRIQPDYIFIDGGNAVYLLQDAPFAIDITAVAAGAAAKAPGFSNPLISHKFGADPWAMEYDGRLYLFMTGDEFEYDNHGHLIENTYGKIKSILVISSADLINWVDHGAIAVSGSDGAAKWARHSWAPAVAHRVVNGRDKFFLYFANDSTNIGVLTADTPLGPWTDPIGGPLIHRGIPGVESVTWCFDPAVLVDDDGQGYLYFGGGLPSDSPQDVTHPCTARVIRLGEDMISTVGEAAVIDAPALFEDSGIHKYGGQYYYSYCSNFMEPHPRGYPRFGEIAYMISDHPMGPFSYAGTILKNPMEHFNVGGNNHHCIFTFKNEWYIAYHTQLLAKALDQLKGYRSPHINRLSYFGDGQLRPVAADIKGVPPTGTLNPFQKTPAATIAWCAGIETAAHPEAGCGMYVTRVHDGSWLAVANADFGDRGAARFSARLASRNGGEIEIRLDNTQGVIAGTLGCGSTGGEEVWAVCSGGVNPIYGIHNVFFIFRGDSGDNLFNFDYWQFD